MLLPLETLRNVLRVSIESNQIIKKGGASMESLLAPILALFELLRSWITSRSSRRKYLFEKVFDPSFDQLLDIHKNYSALLRQAIDTLPLHIGDRGWVDQNYLPINPESDQFADQIEKAKQGITKGRQEYEAEREAIRQNADSFFGEKLHKEEKRFLWAIICYFIRPEIRLKDNQMIDRDVKLLEKQGPDEAIDTPSTAVAVKIASKTDPFEIRKDLEQALFNQLERWSEFCRLYGELKRAVAMKT